ncbi:MAG: ribonuclease P protein component [Clostridia bacterium]
MQKVYRLKKGFQFNYIYRKGKSVAGKEMVLMYARNRNNKILIGVSVSKKIGKSVVRNKVKRRIKESARLLIPQMDKRFNYVIIARTSAVESSYAQINQTLKYLLKKAQLFKQECNEETSLSDNQIL